VDYHTVLSSLIARDDISFFLIIIFAERSHD